MTREERIERYIRQLCVKAETNDTSGIYPGVHMNYFLKVCTRFMHEWEIKAVVRDVLVVAPVDYDYDGSPVWFQSPSGYRLNGAGGYTYYYTTADGDVVDMDEAEYVPAYA